MKESIAIMLVGAFNILAETEIPTGTPPWVLDIGSYGLVGFIVWWILTKTLPNMRADYIRDLAAARDQFQTALTNITERHCVQEERCHQAMKDLAHEIRGTMSSSRTE